VVYTAPATLPLAPITKVPQETVNPITAAQTLTLPEIKSLPSPLKEAVVEAAIINNRTDVVLAATKELTNTQVAALSPPAKEVLMAAKTAPTSGGTSWPLIDPSAYPTPEAAPEPAPEPEALPMISAEVQGGQLDQGAQIMTEIPSPGGFSKILIGGAILVGGFVLYRSFNKGAE